jgi:hypothetical protein
MKIAGLIVILLGAAVMFFPKLMMWFPEIFSVDTTVKGWKDNLYFYMFITMILGFVIWTVGLLTLFVFGLFR